MSEFHTSAQIDENAKLLECIAGLQHRSEFHDVTFLCRDGMRVRANRVFLALRCEFFDRLLFGRMAESRQAEISLPSASSTSLRLLIEFLHTCDVKSLQLDSMAVEAYDLARQYNLPGLQKIIVSFLVRNVRENGAKVGEIISSALSLRANDVAEQLLPVASATLEQGNVHLFEGFSVDALVFSLQHESLRAGRPLEMDIFNAVLYWAVGQFTGERPSFREKSEPESILDDTASSCVLFTKLHNHIGSDSLENLKHVVSDLRRDESLDWKRVLEGVRFECIPTHDLEDTVERLGLVPLELLLKAYRAQAKRFARVALMTSLWDVAVKGSEVRIEQDLCRFESKTHQGARTQASFTSGVHTWQIIVEDYCDLVWVGVVDETVDMGDWLGKQPGGWMYGSNGTLCHSTDQDNGPYNNKYGCSFREDVIDVRLDMHKREMGFSVNGIDHGVAFRDIGHRVFPAVSCRSPGTVRVVFGDKLWSLLGPHTP